MFDSFLVASVSSGEARADHGQIPVAFCLHRFLHATSPSAAPVSATRAEAAPAGAAAWRAPRCGPGSNWTETLCSECEGGETYILFY